MVLLLAERGTVTEAIVKAGWRVCPPRPRRARFAYDTSRACARISLKGNIYWAANRQFVGSLPLGQDSLSICV